LLAPRSPGSVGEPLMGPVVEGIDHVYVPMTDATAAFAALTEDLGLPVLWPFTSFGSFSSGGVSLGNIKLEVIDDNPDAPWSRAQQPPRVQGIALRPARDVDEGYLAELEARRLPHSAPSHFERGGRPAWTNVYFQDLVGEEAGAFVCDYHLPEPKDLDRRRQVLQACGGGRLGVVDAVELVIETRDLDAARRRWQRLFDPLQPREPLSWHLPVGPAVTLTGGEDERVGDLVLAVTSPPEAAAVWRAVASPLRQLPLRFTQARGSPSSAGGAVSGPSA
jgi:hypothetical protein